MTRAFKNFLRRFRQDDTGTASLEFVLVAPFFIGIMIFSIEMGFVTMRATLLERGLDMAVREVRLGTGTAPQHDDIKQIICTNAIMINDCENNLRLEMRPADIRNFNGLDAEADCTDQAEPAKPVREFVPGQQNALMLLRACLKFRPLFPAGMLGSRLVPDGDSQASLVATTAFVQEPI
ncbi:pilus assembly protein [Roseovarius mucosus]|uniref:TadE/TadG family type IV pilus assembly protein n=1 Tax=Roseovarius mucosus TaxID=215743 RepID=UPI001C5E06F2|nr:TadE/TadG family type IV pilus assembly protein [Roseovarius mucosus]MBW4972769.1 pilus assembly protein [Roseovarius mucosus]